MNHVREMQIYTHYLVGCKASEELCARFESGVAIKFGETGNENAIVLFVQKNKWALPLLDSATGWFAPEHPLRQRLILAFAILETTPEFAAHFAPKKQSYLQLIALGFRGVKSLSFALIGKLILVVKA